MIERKLTMLMMVYVTNVGWNYKTNFKYWEAVSEFYEDEQMLMGLIRIGRSCL